MHTYINTYNIIKVPTLVFGNKYLSFPGGSVVKNPSAIAEVAGLIPGLGRSPGEGNGNSSIFAWKIPWTEEPGGLQSVGSQRVGCDLATKQQQRILNVFYVTVPF